MDRAKEFLKELKRLEEVSAQTKVVETESVSTKELYSKIAQLEKQLTDMNNKLEKQLDDIYEFKMKTHRSLGRIITKLVNALYTGKPRSVILDELQERGFQIGGNEAWNE